MGWGYDGVVRCGGAEERTWACAVAAYPLLLRENKVAGPLSLCSSCSQGDV